MATETAERPQSVAVFHEPRLPFHPAIQERFGVDRSGWKALTEAIYPAAKSTDSVVMALSYCKARNLDPFKRPVHIVPMWDSKAKTYVETVWPGIAELRTTAFRTGQYAGCDETEFGPPQTVTFKGKVKKGDSWVEEAKTVTFPSWARITVYRTIGERVAKFVGPKVLWLESYATIGNSDLPNDMWESRPEGQLEKCAEAASLRKAFPEELGNLMSAEEMEGRGYEAPRDITPPAEEKPARKPPAPSMSSPPLAPEQEQEKPQRRAPAPDKAPQAEKVIEGEVLPPAKPEAAKAAAMEDDAEPAKPSQLPRLLELMAAAKSEDEANDVYANEEAAIAGLSETESEQLAKAYDAKLEEFRPSDGPLPLPRENRETWKAECFAIMEKATSWQQILDWWSSEENKAQRTRLGIPQEDRKAVVAEGERHRVKFG